MKNKLWKSPLKVLAATSVTIFTLLSVFTSTAAWFDSRRSLDNGANQMEVAVTTQFKSLSIYRAVNATDEGYYFPQTPDYVTDPSRDWVANPVISLGSPLNLDPATPYPAPYSPLSHHHPLMIVVEYVQEINASQNPFAIVGYTDDYFLTDTTSDDTKHTVAATGNPLSSVIMGYSFGYNTLSNTPTDLPTGMYNASTCYYYSANALAKDRNKEFRFATLSGLTASFDHSKDFFRANSGSYNKIAIIFDYDPDLIEFIFNYYLGNEILNDVISFTCDWVMAI